MVCHSFTILKSVEGYLSNNHQSQIFTANLHRSSVLVLEYVHKLYSIIKREGLEGRIWRALELFVHSVAKTLLPPPESCWRHTIAAPDPASLVV